MKSPALLLLACCTLFFAPPAASAARGDLDSTFGSGGRVATILSSEFFTNCVAVPGNGKIVVGGRMNGFMVARYHANGSLDTTFNGNGFNMTPIDGYGAAEGIVVQEDGRILEQIK